MTATESSLWGKLSLGIQSAELEEISRAVGNRLIDSNKSLWLEFEAMLEIFCDNAGGAGGRASILMAIALKLKSCPVANIVKDFKSTEVMYCTVVCTK